MSRSKCLVTGQIGTRRGCECIRCAKTRERRRKWRFYNLEKAREQHRKWYYRHHEHALTYAERYDREGATRLGRSAIGPRHPREPRLKLSPEELKVKSCIRGKKARDETRRIVIAHYSNDLNCCACCAENEYSFLTIDHINGGGTQQRKELKMRGSRLYLYLIRNHFPEGYQILCYNCNCAKGLYGQCPHQVKKEKGS